MRNILIVSVLAAGSIALAPTVQADVWCDIMAEKPSIQQAENMILATGMSAYEQGIDPTAAGKLVAKDIATNCPQYANMVIAGAQNVSDRIDQMGG